jgi:PAS domain S-box-containing protein
MLTDLESSLEIDNACSVDEAFKKLTTCNYDVVVSDYEMPQENGLQFLKELREQKNDVPFILFTGKGREEVAISALNLGADGYYNKQGSPETVYGELAHGIKLSVERKNAKASLLLNELRLQCDLGINKMVDASNQELMDYALEAITKITQSEFAFIDLLDQNETIMTIYSWSKTAMKECQVRVKPIHYPVSEAGIWAEPIRQRKPVIINDYSIQMPHKKGVPEGHVKIERFLGVPLFEKEHIVAIAAVANKKGCYDETDVGHITSLLTDMWRLIQRKKAEASLKETKTQLELQIKRMPIACIFWDKDFKVVSWNPASEKIFGYSAEEIVGKHPYGAIVPKEAQPIVEKIWRRLLEGDETAHSINDNFTKAGELITCSWTNTPLKREDNSVIGVLSMVQDITEREKAKRDLRESEERYRSLFEQAPLPVAITTLDGTLFDANVSMQTFLGYSLEELKKTSVISLYENDQDREKLFETLRQNGIASDFYTRLKRKDGTCVDVFLNVSKFQIGKERFLRTTIQDVTKRKEAEEALNRTMDELVIVNEKLGVVGNLTRHDVRNKLSAITGNIYLLKKKHSDNPEIINRLGQMEEACRSIVEIFDFAKMYEQIGVGKLNLTDVGKTIDEAKAFFSSSSNVKIINSCQGLAVNADSMLRQLFYNLIDNSLKHGKTVTEIKLWFNSGTSVIKLFYEDNGVGIIEANKSLIFSEGFTTGGTGLGLKLIKKIIESYGWTMEENGIPSKGARFQMTIPKSALFY